MTTTGPLIGFLPFDRLTVAQRAAVASTARQVSIDSGQPIFEEEQPAVGCWLIHSGHIELSTHVPGRGSHPAHNDSSPRARPRLRVSFTTQDGIG